MFISKNLSRLESRNGFVKWYWVLEKYYKVETSVLQVEEFWIIEETCGIVIHNPKMVLTMLSSHQAVWYNSRWASK